MQTCFCLAQVTRKVIRKCISADGDEREEMSAEGGPQGSEGGRYSKVVKRTIVKSEGENTEVCVLLVTLSVRSIKLFF